MAHCLLVLEGKYWRTPTVRAHGMAPPAMPRPRPAPSRAARRAPRALSGRMMNDAL